MFCRYVVALAAFAAPSSGLSSETTKTGLRRDLEDGDKKKSSSKKDESKKKDVSDNTLPQISNSTISRNTVDVDLALLKKDALSSDIVEGEESEKQNVENAEESEDGFATEVATRFEKDERRFEKDEKLMREVVSDVLDRQKVMARELEVMRGNLPSVSNSSRDEIHPDNNKDHGYMRFRNPLQKGRKGLLAKEKGIGDPLLDPNRVVVDRMPLLSFGVCHNSGQPAAEIHPEHSTLSLQKTTVEICGCSKRFYGFVETSCSQSFPTVTLGQCDCTQGACAELDVDLLRSYKVVPCDGQDSDAYIGLQGKKGHDSPRSAKKHHDLHYRGRSLRRALALSREHKRRTAAANHQTTM